MSLSTAYDPTDPEDQPKSGHLSRKDLLRITIIIAITLIILIPVYQKLMFDRNKYMCRTHLGEVLKAMQLYAEINTDRFPPAFAVADDGTPIMSGKRVNTWVSVVSGMMNDPNSEFTCPAAGEDEHVANAGGEGKTMLSDFGIFGAMATMARSNVANPSQTALVTETSSRGSRDTYNPMPFEGQFPDGFVIGFNNTNFLPEEPYSIFKDSKFATRLSFSGTGKGNFQGAQGRHGFSNHILYVDGHIGSIKSHQAEIRRQGEELFGIWSVR